MNAKHIFIAGVSHSGSTLFNLCLGTLPGCAGVNETNWLVPWPGQTLADFRFDGPPPEVCRGCEGPCPVLTADFREGLQRTPLQWGERILAATGEQRLVTAEKSIVHLDALYPGRDVDVIVLFRHPWRFWESKRRRTGEFRTEAQDVRIHQRRIFRRWLLSYQELTELEVFGQKTFVEFDDFSVNPTQAMRSLADKLGLEYSSAFLRYWDHPHHYVGGSFDLRALRARNPDRMVIGRSPGRAAPDDTLKAKAVYGSAVGLYEDLRGRSQD